VAATKVRYIYVRARAHIYIYKGGRGADFEATPRYGIVVAGTRRKLESDDL